MDIFEAHQMLVEKSSQLEKAMEDGRKLGIILPKAERELMDADALRREIERRMLSAGSTISGLQRITSETAADSERRFAENPKIQVRVHG